MEHFSATFHEFNLSTDPAFQQIDIVHGMLKRTHWASNRTRETVEKSIRTSLCFGVYRQRTQVAFARVVTDYCTFAYLCDVVVLESYRGKGLAKWLMDCVMKHPDLKGLRRFVLATKDSHTLYERYGFKALSESEQTRFMEIFDNEV